MRALNRKSFGKKLSVFGLSLFFIAHAPLAWSRPPSAACEQALERAAARGVKKEESTRAKLLANFLLKNLRKPKSATELADIFEITPAALAKLQTIEGNPTTLDEWCTWAAKSKSGFSADMEEAIGKAAAKSLKEDLVLPTLNPELLAFMPRTAQKLSVMDLILKHNPKSLDVIRNALVSAYVKAAKIYGATPKIDLIAKQLRISPEEATALIANPALFKEGLTSLKEMAMDLKPNAFANVLDLDRFTPEYDEQTLRALETAQRYIVTTAVAGAKVNQEFLAALRRYARLNNAEIFVFASNFMTTGLDPILFETEGVHVITHSMGLNPYLTLNNMKLMAKMMNPLTRTHSNQGNRGESQIFGHPQMRSEIVPTHDNVTHVHQMFTTGCLTEPNYAGAAYISRRTDKVAVPEHVMGALIVEKNAGDQQLDIPTTGSFHMRHIEYIPQKKGFLDLGLFYAANTTEKVRPEALVMGDIHVGDTDQRVLESLKRQILKLRPRVVILHDLLNGHSISHHEMGQTITLEQRAMSGKLNLEKELAEVVAFINALLKTDPELQIVIAASNHDFWLNRWLQEARYTVEPQNTLIGAELYLAYAQGKNPLEYALLDRGTDHAREVDRSYVTRVDDRNRVTFLNNTDSFKRGPDLDPKERNRKVELAKHGHEGPNGARGSINSMHYASDRMVFGHTHQTKRWNGTVNVATSTLTRLGYTGGGPSSWTQSLALVGPNGEVQVLSLVDNEWFTDPNREPLTPGQFFPAGYPYLMPNEGDPNTEGQIDQWSRQR